MPNTPSLLVAEDNPALAAVLKFNLEKAGYAVKVGKNGRVAFELAQSSQFDLVLTDQQMPEMTGTELCEKLRDTSDYSDTPIIMLTAKSLELSEHRIKDQLKVSELIAKPFSPKSVVSIVNSLLQPALH